MQFCQRREDLYALQVGNAFPTNTHLRHGSDLPIAEVAVFAVVLAENPVAEILVGEVRLVDGECGLTLIVHPVASVHLQHFPVFVLGGIHLHDQYLIAGGCLIRINIQFPFRRRPSVTQSIDERIHLRTTNGVLIAP